MKLQVKKRVEKRDKESVLSRWQKGKHEFAIYSGVLKHCLRRIILALTSQEKR